MILLIILGFLTLAGLGIMAVFLYKACVLIYTLISGRKEILRDIKEGIADGKANAHEDERLRLLAKEEKKAARLAKQVEKKERGN